MSSTYLPAVADAEFPEGSTRALQLNGWPVLLCRTDGALRAVIDRCSHQASDLHSGRVRRGVVMCPLHGARFELASGRCIGGSYPSLLTFALRVEGGTIEIEIPDDAPGADYTPVASA